MRTILLIICVTFLSDATYAPVINACMICVPYPKATLTDVLNERESIVFAREKIGKAYFFYTVEVLKGAIDRDEFKAFIYSVDRRKLSKNLKGFSVLGSEGGIPFKPEIVVRRHRIVKSYATLLDNYPIMAGLVAKDLTNWKTRALVPQLSRIKNGEPILDPKSLFAVNYYLSMASKFPAIN